MLRFGNKGSFDKTTHTSIGQYTEKKNVNPIKQANINDIANRYEKLTDSQISSSITSLSKFIPEIRSLISPVLETAFEIQQNTTDINLNSTASSKDGCWQTTICMNTSAYSVEI
jgi:hypothetical protein